LIMGGIVIGKPTRRDLFFFQRRSGIVVLNMAAPLFGCSSVASS
jgi:hypothetical protein